MSPVASICSGCGRQIPLGGKRGRCDSCRRTYEREKSRARRGKKGTTAQQGYGRRHKTLRATYEKQIATGLVKCWRCGRPIAPGEPWDLGHDDYDRRRYRGPEHRGCNRATAGREVMIFSRRW